MKKAILILAITLSGCSATIPVAPSQGLITITPDMVAECAALKPFAGKTKDDLGMAYLDVIAAYKVCALENHDKAMLMRKIFGVKVEGDK